MKTITFPPSAALAALLLLSAGCSLLEPKADLTQFYVLRAPAPAAAGVARPEAGGPAIRIGPGTIAGYLEVMPLVIQDGPNRLRRLDQHHWAEPLSEGIARALGESLALKVPGAAVTRYPDPAPGAASFEVRYTVNRFEGALDGAVTLDVAWQLVAQPSGAIVASAHPVYEIPAAGRSGDVAGYVECLSRALDRWSEELAAAMAAQRSAGQ
jgi:uncharacterized lipoprotein YmbA